MYQDYIVLTKLFLLSKRYIMVDMMQTKTSRKNGHYVIPIEIMKYTNGGINSYHMIIPT